jgi:hypothetical protein
MKNILTLFCCAISLLYFTNDIYSQKIRYDQNPYSSSIGLRVGSENGLAFKHFIKPTWAFEGTVTTGYRSLIFTALIEKEFSVSDENGPYLLVGGGLHAGQWGQITHYRQAVDYQGTVYYYRSYENTPSAGLDGVVGIEYKLPDTPFTIGADLKPFFDVYHVRESWMEGAISLRYILK